MIFRILVPSLMIFGLLTMGLTPIGGPAVPVALAQDDSATHVAVGTVEQIDSAKKTVTISQGAD